MKKKLLFLLLFVAISLFSCKSRTSPFANLNSDFPVAEKLEFKPFNKYEIYSEGNCSIDDSVLWYFANNNMNIGYCYDLNTGKKLSTIAMKGKASYELTSSPGYDFVGDSIQFYTDQNVIKTFAKKDIVENKLMGERGYSVTTTPDSICAIRLIKLPNGSVIATIRPLYVGFDKNKINEINNNSIAIINDNEITSYETIDYDSFNLKQRNGIEKEKNISENYQIKMSYCNGHIDIKSNDMVVFTMDNQFILHTFDIKSGKVVKEKRYTEAKGEGQQTTNDFFLEIDNIRSNDKYIYCLVSGYFSEEDKKSNISKESIFVFDWDLNPIKRFDLPVKEYSHYKISEDCNSIYFCTTNDEGLTLTKADLNL